MAENRPYTVERHAGRLVEARLLRLESTLQVTEFTEEMRRAFARVRGKCVIVADWRQAGLMPPHLADALVELLRRGNAHFLRSAIVLSNEDALFNLQVERVVREASNHARRAFRLPSAARVWAAEVLTPAELHRLDVFLGLAGA